MFLPHSNYLTSWTPFVSVCNLWTTAKNKTNQLKSKLAQRHQDTMCQQCPVVHFKLSMQHADYWDLTLVI